tara:strand:+ start:9442 stop:9672 length:231 start_codon:yes stop_codon:yes gene_type:complete
MQADGWLVEDINDPNQSRANLGSQSNSLGFAATECAAFSVERELRRAVGVLKKDVAKYKARKQPDLLKASGREKKD